MTTTVDPSDTDATEAATMAGWAEHWRRWVEAHGREPHTAIDADSEASLLFDMAAFGGGVRLRRSLVAVPQVPDPPVGVFTPTGVVSLPHPGPYSGSLFVGKPDKRADPSAPFTLVALAPGAPIDALRTFAIWWAYATPDPIGRHHELAAAVVEAKSPGLDDEQATRARRALAVAVADTVRGWGPALGFDWAGLSKLPQLDGWSLADSDPARDIGGLDIGASLDRVADFLEGIGDEGKTAARRYRGKTDPGLWVRPSGPKAAPDGPTRSPLLWSLAVALWLDLVGPALDREATAKPFRRPTVHEDGGYVLAPKPLPSLSWALGGYGERVEVDGEDYRPAPGLTRYAPRMMAALPSGRSPAQRYLPLDVDNGLDEAVPMEIRVAADARMVVSELAGKLAVFLMAAARPGLTRLTVGDLTRHLSPAAKRYQARDFEATVRALNGVRTLAIVPDRYAPINLFELVCPREGEADPDLPVLWGFSKALDAAMAGGGANIPSFAGKRSWGGSFLLNLTKAMQIPTRLSVALRLYVYSAAKINEVRPRGFDAMPWLTAEQWAALGNTVSPAALDYAMERSDKRRKVDLSEARKRTTDALDYLHNNGLLFVEADAGKGSRRKYQVKPTEAFEAAHRKIRNGGDS